MRDARHAGSARRAVTESVMTGVRRSPEAIRRSVTTSRLIRTSLLITIKSPMSAPKCFTSDGGKCEANNPAHASWINGNDISATLNDRIMRCCTKAIDIDVDAVLDRAMHSDGSPPLWKSSWSPNAASSAREP